MLSVLMTGTMVFWGITHESSTLKDLLVEKGLKRRVPPIVCMDQNLDRLIDASDRSGRRLEDHGSILGATGIAL